MKRFLYYLIWTIVIGFVLYGGVHIHDLAVERSRATFDVFPVFLFIGLFPVFVGLLLRMPKFVLQLKVDQPWKFDWAMFLAVVLPALYLVVMTFLPFSPFGSGRIQLLMSPSNAGTAISTIAGVVFGYALLSSFKKISHTKREAAFRS